MTTIPQSKKPLRGAALSALIVVVIAWLAINNRSAAPPAVAPAAPLLDTRPSTSNSHSTSNRHKAVIAMNEAFSLIGKEGEASLNPEDDQVLYITAEWMDKANANGWIAGVRPSTLRT